MGDQDRKMQLKVGEIVEGTVKSLTKFGAFVALDANTTGLVHISEVAHAYVSDLHEYLTEGQTVKVMVIGRKAERSIFPSSAPCLRPRGSRPSARAAASSSVRRSRTGSSRPRRSRNRSTICSSSSCPSRTAKCPPFAPIPTTRPRPENDNRKTPRSGQPRGARSYL